MVVSNLGANPLVLQVPIGSEDQFQVGGWRVGSPLGFLTCHTFPTRRTNGMATSRWCGSLLLAVPSQSKAP
jgi:hypothetical protein